MKRRSDSEVDWQQLKDLFPILGRITERQIRRLEALRKLKERSQEEDESEQLRKVKAKQILSSLVELEKWK